MLKHITVSVIIDDHEPEKCGAECLFRDEYNWECTLLQSSLARDCQRCKQCLEEAK